LLALLAKLSRELKKCEDGGVSPGRSKLFSTMDASFADSLSKALTGLTFGKAVVKLMARPGE